MAETEKYPHVTYFFNGGVEEPFVGEHRHLIPSPEVATYDLKPEMSAPELTDALLEHIGVGRHDFILVNYANADMVGHTGSIPAAIAAVETVDACVGRVLHAVAEAGGTALVTADHGNAEKMLGQDGSPLHGPHHLSRPPDPLLAAGVPSASRQRREAGRRCPHRASSHGNTPAARDDGAKLADHRGRVIVWAFACASAAYAIHDHQTATRH